MNTEFLHDIADKMFLINGTTLDEYSSKVADEIVKLLPREEFANKNYCPCSTCLAVNILEHVGLEKVNKNGKFATRLIKFIKYAYEYSIDSTLAGYIGQVLREDTQKATSLYANITFNFDWRPGTFGYQESESCFWKSRRYAKDMILNSGGFAIQLWEDSNKRVGIARCWVIPHGDSFVFFNIYGNSNSTMFAKVLDTILHSEFNFGSSQYSHENFYEVKTFNHNTDSGPLWINPGHGNGKAWILPFDITDLYSYVDFNIDHPDFKPCSVCGYLIHIDDINLIFDDDGNEFYVCDECE